MVERVFSRLKDQFGARHLRLRGATKVMAHLMFGVVALTVGQLLKLTGSVGISPDPIGCRKTEHRSRGVSSRRSHSALCCKVSLCIAFYYPKHFVTPLGASFATQSQEPLAK